MPPHVVEAFVTKIVTGKDGFDWYLRFNGDPDQPLHCKLDGKRKNTTRITVSGANSPAVDESATGCHQRWRELKNYRKYAAFSVTCDNAKAYIYSFSRHRRFHKRTGIKVNLFI